jgi:hypothetical protein
MTASSPSPTPPQEEERQLNRVARFPEMRALSWSGDLLYASRGYDLLRAHVSDEALRNGLRWDQVASFRPALRRRLSVTTRLSSRLFRDGFHALATPATGGIVAAVPGAIVTLRPNEPEFRVTHTIARGTRPLHITAIPNGNIVWGEYFDNADRDEVHIYASTDSGSTWNVAYTFPKGAIRHVHNIVHDPWGGCLWILTGDYGDECRILRASYDFRTVEAVVRGNQQARAVAMVLAEDGLYFASDTPLELNYVYRLARSGELSRLAPISSSSIYGCRVGERVFFSTMVEPSDVNRDRSVRIFSGRTGAPVGETKWSSVLAWQKDLWSLKFLQYGNAFLPDGENSTNCLALTSIAVRVDDCVMSLYSLRS